MDFRCMPESTSANDTKVIKGPMSTEIAYYLTSSWLYELRMLSEAIPLADRQGAEITRPGSQANYAGKGNQAGISQDLIHYLLK